MLTPRRPGRSTLRQLRCSDARRADWRFGPVTPLARRHGAAPRADARSGRARALFNSVAQHRPGSRRPIDRHLRREGPAERRLLRRDRRRAVEDHRQGRDVGAGDRRPDPQLVGRRGRRVGNESRHRLHRHGRVVHPRQHHAGRRRLQVDRRRQDVDARRLPDDASASRRSASIRPTRTSSSSRRSASYSVAERRARRLQDHRRRQDVEAHAVPRQQDRRRRPLDRSQQSRTSIYAALWEAFRMEYTMSSGGPGSGLFKSTDGGEHWTEITRNPGLPRGHRSARSACRSRARTRIASTRSSRTTTAASSAPTTRARRGR